MHWIDKVIPPIILGHRGASKSAPENTIAAFRQALESGADGFELDTMLSFDRVPVVIHDSTLERTTNATGLVHETNSKILRNLDAGSKFSTDFSDQKIPSLEEVLEEFKNRAIINVELKNAHNPFDALPFKVIDLVNKIGMLDQVLFSSFNPLNLRRIRKIQPDAKTALICSNRFLGNTLASEQFSFISPNFIHPHLDICSSEYISRQHQINRKVNAWTVNDENEMKQLITDKIDGIITDDPELAIKMKQGNKGN